MKFPDISLHFFALTYALAISGPIWIPLVFAGYAVGKGKFSLRVLLIFVTIEACALAFLVWFLAQIE